MFNGCHVTLQLYVFVISFFLLLYIISGSLCIVESFGIFRDFLKEYTVVTERICWGSPFHILAAAYLKDLSPYVFSLDRFPCLYLILYFMTHFIFIHIFLLGECIWSEDIKSKILNWESNHLPSGIMNTYLQANWRCKVSIELYFSWNSYNWCRSRHGLPQSIINTIIRVITVK